MSPEADPTDRRGRVGGLVLAAGASARMGVDKLRLEIGGRPLLLRAVDAARGAGLAPIVIVTRPGSCTQERLPLPKRCRVVENPDPARGPGSSLATGLGAVREEELAAVAVLLADTPFVDATLVARLVAVWRRSRRPIVAAGANGVPMPPVVFGRAMLAELAAVPPERGGRALLAARPERVEVVSVSEEVLADVDRPGDWARLRSRAGDEAGSVPF